MRFQHLEQQSSAITGSKWLSCGRWEKVGLKFRACPQSSKEKDTSVVAVSAGRRRRGKDRRAGSFTAPRCRSVRRGILTRTFPNSAGHRTAGPGTRSTGFRSDRGGNFRLSVGERSRTRQEELHRAPLEPAGALLRIDYLQAPSAQVKCDSPGFEPQQRPRNAPKPPV